MSPSANPELERQVREACERGDLRAATEAALRAYGREVYEFLAATHRSEADAADVFAAFSEAMWRGLAGFRWGSSLRTWAYGVARNASLRFRRDERRRAKRALPLADGELSALVEQVRSETASYLRTEKRSRIEELRRALPANDQELLLLRVGRQLPWAELADVLHDPDLPPLDDEGRKREAARLRKRFQLVKAKLYEMGREQGLVTDEPEG